MLHKFKIKMFFGSNQKHFQEKTFDLIFERSVLLFTMVQTIQKIKLLNINYQFKKYFC